MEELTIIIIIYAVFLIGESPSNDRKKKPSLFGEDDDEFIEICGGCIADDRQKVYD